jgi:hypothetical protein
MSIALLIYFGQVKTLSIAALTYHHPAHELPLQKTQKEIPLAAKRNESVLNWNGEEVDLPTTEADEVVVTIVIDGLEADI